jgi:hypothetical protein
MRDALRRLRRLREGVPPHVERLMREKAQQIFAESQERVPVATGELRRFGTLREVRTPNGVEFEIAYGAPHAVAVHETHPTGKKFLEVPASQVLDRAPRDIGEQLRAAIRKLVE